jgi:hypothetical protein
MLKPPAYGSPCNMCGKCCQEEVCGIGKAVLGDDIQAPCPLLVKDGERFLCGVVKAEAESRLPKLTALALGIGRGCDADFGD